MMWAYQSLQALPDFHRDLLRTELQLSFIDAMRRTDGAPWSASVQARDWSRMHAECVSCRSTIAGDLQSQPPLSKFHRPEISTIASARETLNSPPAQDPSDSPSTS